MRIVYTCPECGADIEDIVLATYPPKYMKRCTNPKCKWRHIEEVDDGVVRIPYTQAPIDWINVSDDSIPSCCRNCANHPKNGGSGICHCTLPYMTSTGDIISYGVRC